MGWAAAVGWGGMGPGIGSVARFRTVRPAPRDSWGSLLPGLSLPLPAL